MPAAHSSKALRDCGTPGAASPATPLSITLNKIPDTLPTKPTLQPVAPPPLPKEHTPHTSPDQDDMDLPTLLPPPHYLGPDEVEQKAELVELPDAEDSFPMDIKGRLIAKVYVSERGEVDSIEIIDNDLPEPYAATIIRSLSRAAFTPAMSNGRPSGSWKLFELGIRLPEPTADPDSSASQ